MSNAQSQRVLSFLHTHACTLSHDLLSPLCLSAFGQHPNGDIQSHISETNSLLQNLLMLQPRASAGPGSRKEDAMLETTQKLLEQCPPPLDIGMP